MSAYTFAVGPWNSAAPTRKLDTAAGRQVAWRLDAPSEAGCTIDGRSEDVDAVNVLATDLWVYRQGRPTLLAPGVYSPAEGSLIFRGRIVAAPETITEDAHAVGVSAVDYRGVLGARRLHEALTFAATAPAQIAWALIEHAQAQPGGGLGITQGALLDSTPRDSDEYEIGDSIGERIAELGRVEDGFEWWVDELLRLQVAAERGSDSSAVLDYGGVVAAVNREPHVSGYANAVIVTGGEDTMPADLDGDVLDDPRGRWETAAAYSDVKLQATLDAKAAWLLGMSERPPISYAVTLVQGAWPDDVSVGVGDRCWLLIQSGRRNERQRVRIEELTLTVGESGDDKVALSCTAEGAPL